MSEGNNNKSRVWIYAVVLFSSAFIVLLLTAYSQIRLNGSITQYKSQLSNMKQENDNKEFDLNSAIELNEELSEKIDELNKKIENSDEKIKEADDELKRYEEKNKNILASYEGLMEAQSEYENGNFKESAMLLQDKCNPSNLGESALEKYNKLRVQVYKKASHEAYIDGYNFYKNKKYDEAIKNFMLSVELTGNEYYSDDSYFFTAYSYYYNNDYVHAREAAEKLLEKYPGSTYVSAIKGLISMMN